MLKDESAPLLRSSITGRPEDAQNIATQLHELSDVQTADCNYLKKRVKDAPIKAIHCSIFLQQQLIAITWYQTYESHSN